MSENELINISNKININESEGLKKLIQFYIDLQRFVDIKSTVDQSQALILQDHLMNILLEITERDERTIKILTGVRKSLKKILKEQFYL